MAVDVLSTAIGLLGGGGIAGIASVVLGSRQQQVATKVEETRSAVDGFDKLTGRLETRLASLEAETKQKDIDCAARCAVKDERIAELERHLREGTR